MLKPFDTCDTVLQYFKNQAPDYLIDRARGVTTTDSGGAAERLAATSATASMTIPVSHPETTANPSLP